jgi:hypothetical protein
MVRFFRVVIEGYFDKLSGKGCCFASGAGMRNEAYFYLAKAIGRTGKGNQANFSEPVKAFIRAAWDEIKYPKDQKVAFDDTFMEAFIDEADPEEETAQNRSDCAQCYLRNHPELLA